MPVRLRLLRPGDGRRRIATPILCLMQSNEGFYVRLDETKVLRWLSGTDSLGPAPDGVRLGGRLIEEFARIQDNDDVRILPLFGRVPPGTKRSQACLPVRVHATRHDAHHLIEVSASMSGLDLRLVR